MAEKIKIKNIYLKLDHTGGKRTPDRLLLDTIQCMAGSERGSLKAHAGCDDEAKIGDNTATARGMV